MSDQITPNREYFKGSVETERSYSAVHRVGGRLMRDNSNAAFASDNAVTDRQGLGLHTEAEQARVLLHGDD